MAERLSTGLADAINAAVATAMTNSVIHIYSGSQPATADAAETGTLLMILTESGGAFVSGLAANGLNMGTSSNGVLPKASAETWQGVGLGDAGTGTVAGWFRWYANTVVTGISTTAVRMDGAVGSSAAFEMQMSNTTIVEDGPATVNTFSYTTTKQ